MGVELGSSRIDPITGQSCIFQICVVFGDYVSLFFDGHIVSDVLLCRAMAVRSLEWNG